MRVRDLINSCQNQFKNMFSKNDKFRFSVLYSSNGGVDTYSANYLDEGVLAKDYWEKQVQWWEIRDNNCIFISVVGLYD